MTQILSSTIFTVHSLISVEPTGWDVQEVHCRGCFVYRKGFKLDFFSQYIPVMPSISEPQPVTDYIADGARIAAILLVWGVIAVFFVYGMTEIGLPFERVWFQLGRLFALTGFLNALLYILYRTVDYWHTSA